MFALLFAGARSGAINKGRVFSWALRGSTAAVRLGLGFFFSSVPQCSPRTLRYLPTKNKDRANCAPAFLNHTFPIAQCLVFRHRRRDVSRRPVALGFMLLVGSRLWPARTPMRPFPPDGISACGPSPISRAKHFRRGPIAPVPRILHFMAVRVHRAGCRSSRPPCRLPFSDHSAAMVSI